MTPHSASVVEKLPKTSSTAFQGVLLESSLGCSRQAWAVPPSHATTTHHTSWKQTRKEKNISQRFSRCIVAHSLLRTSATFDPIRQAAPQSNSWPTRATACHRATHQRRPSIFNEPSANCFARELRLHMCRWMRFHLSKTFLKRFPHQLETLTHFSTKLPVTTFATENRLLHTAG